jgi:hypothetical protein
MGVNNAPPKLSSLPRAAAGLVWLGMLVPLSNPVFGTVANASGNMDVLLDTLTVRSRAFRYGGR